MNSVYSNSPKNNKQCKMSIFSVISMAFCDRYVKLQSKNIQTPLNTF